MAKCTPTIVPQLVEDKCKGKQYSTDCTIFEDAIPYLFLTENSTVTDVINSSIQSLVDARNRVEQLEILNQGIESDLILKADKNSPVLTGTPTAPTATAGTNTTQIATTAFVQAVARPYKVYTALLTQTGTNAPVATVLENTLGGTVVWSYASTGVYVANLTGAFTINKTIVFTSNAAYPVTPPHQFTGGVRSNSDSIQITSKNGSGTLTNDLISSMSLEIRVYN